ncbi:MAG: NlpC/P60 family protein [Clostridium sp.]
MGPGKQPEMRPGDIICYSLEEINHVALCIGNGQIVRTSTERTGIRFQMELPHLKLKS